MAIVTLTTDFGLGSSYVAEMKGVILGINPAATVVDITHSIQAQAIHQAAFVVAQSISTFPAGTVHVVVVDPGVGTDRKIITAKVGDWHFVCPDNGVIQLAASKFGLTGAVELTQPDFWRSDIAPTFHGRDVMAPVAAHLSAGVDSEQMGCDLDQLVEIEFPIPSFEDDQVSGEVVWIDNFGNLITNIDEEALSEFELDSTEVRFDDHCISGIHRTFGERNHGELVAYMGSSGHLEIARVNGNLAHSAGIHVGQSVSVQES